MSRQSPNDDRLEKKLIPPDSGIRGQSEKFSGYL